MNTNQILGTVSTDDYGMMISICTGEGNKLSAHAFEKFFKKEGYKVKYRGKARDNDFHYTIELKWEQYIEVPDIDWNSTLFQHMLESRNFQFESL